MQLAKHTPTQVIKLAYLCALLEQRSQKSTSKRYTAITEFLEKAVQVVPVESAFDSITYGKHEIALTCAKILHERSPQLQPSQHMIMGALRASIRARTGYDGKVIDRYIIPSVRTYQQAVQAAVRWLDNSSHLHGHPIPLPPIAITTQVVVQSKPQPKKPRLMPRPKFSASSSVGGEKKPNFQRAQPSRTYSEAIKNSTSQATHIMAMPLPFPVFLNPHHFPVSHPFPEYIIQYLEDCLRKLIGQIQAPTYSQCHVQLQVVTRMNIGELYSPRKRSSAHFKSPLQILSEGSSQIKGLAESLSFPATKLPNEEMLAIVQNIYKKDVALCALLLGAFMEQQIRIPLIYTAKNTAETLSSNAAPVAVGVWALFSQNLTTLQDKLASNNRSQLIIDIREYIEGISQQLPETEAEDRMYAGKLQFLLQGMQQIVTASSQYISYSLERQLYSSKKVDRNETLKHLITQWDKIFKNDALSLIGESHRPLVARWLKWTILIHDLRETLAQYTCIGVTGLVNSGKSLLVQKVFKIEVCLGFLCHVTPHLLCHKWNNRNADWHNCYMKRLLLNYNFTCIQNCRISS